jgi:hypothetical protein
VDKLTNPEAKGAVVCVHTMRWLTDREIELVKIAVQSTLEALFCMVIK